MKNRVRIQPYISADLRRRLASYSAAQGVTESAVAQAALTEYLAPDSKHEDLILRRLDGIAKALDRGEERLEIVAEAVGRFTRFALSFAPKQTSQEATSRAEELSRDLIGAVARAVGTGTTFIAAVRRARLRQPVAAPGPAARPGQ